MCKLRCFLALFTLSTSTVYSWDIAITAENAIVFYDKNGTKLDTVDVPDGKLTALAYDAVYNILFFVDKHSDNASIFSYNFTSKTTHALVSKKTNELIKGVAFDPLTRKIFWTDYETGNIFYETLNVNGDENEQRKRFGTKLFRGQQPRGIAVDSCRGYIYWTNTKPKPGSITRAKFNIPKAEINTVVDANSTYFPVSVAIDQRDKRMYWADDEDGRHYSIWSADLNGKHKVLLLKDIDHEPNSLTISKDSVYWIDLYLSKVWSIPKTAQNDNKPRELTSFSGSPTGIAANYAIKDQLKGTSDCQELSKIYENPQPINDFIDVPQDAGIQCLHGTPEKDGVTCRCSKGYTGNRCENHVCNNFCLNGKCELSDSEPKCICEPGFTGPRCEINRCWNHCLNGGRCSYTQSGEIVCACGESYEGPKCEREKRERTAVDNVVEKGNLTESFNVVPGTNDSTIKSEDGDFVTYPACDGWDPIRDPVLILLGTISGILCVCCAILITKVKQLQKRPRIKKRIIVNKNVTPLTARPDQCEITIENCCNMNICETPCFEPRSTIRPKLRDSKPGKEERSNLIANMELPDD